MENGVMPLLRMLLWALSLEPGLGGRQKLRSGCRRLLKGVRTTSMCSSPCCAPRTKKNWRVDLRKGEVNGTGRWPAKGTGQGSDCPSNAAVFGPPGSNPIFGMLSRSEWQDASPGGLEHSVNDRNVFCVVGSIWSQRSGWSLTSICS